MFCSQSMTDFSQLQDFQSNCSFNYTKSAWKTDYGDILQSKLSQVVRRKSCLCTGCGCQNKKILRILGREILNEPIYPYIKS